MFHLRSKSTTPFSYPEGFGSRANYAHAIFRKTGRTFSPNIERSSDATFSLRYDIGRNCYRNRDETFESLLSIDTDFRRISPKTFLANRLHKPPCWLVIQRFLFFLSPSFLHGYSSSYQTSNDTYLYSVIGMFWLLFYKFFFFHVFENEIVTFSGSGKAGLTCQPK